MLVREVKSDFSLQYRAAPRTPGQHVSEVIRDIALQLGLLSRDDQEELDWTLAKYRLQCGDPGGVGTMFPTAIYRVAAGLAWEEWLGGQWPHMNFHSVGELERDRLIGTPDGLEFWDRTPDPEEGQCPLCKLHTLDWRHLSQCPGGSGQRIKPLPLRPGCGAIHEIKLTWKSSRSGREPAEVRMLKEFMWLAQTKAYCWMASQPGYPVLVALLHVYWVNGNYKGGGPEFRTYELTFTEQELRANWHLITQTARRLKELSPGASRRVA